MPSPATNESTEISRGAIEPSSPWSAPPALARRLLHDEALSASPQRMADPHLLGADGPRHATNRRLLDRALARASVGAAPAVRAAASARLADLAGAVDLVDELAVPVASALIAHLLGLHSREAAPLAAGARRAARLGAGVEPPTPEGVAAVQRLGGQVAGLVKRARLQGVPGLARELLTVGLSDDVAASVLRIVVIGAVETTSRLIAATLHALLQDERTQQSLRHAPQRVPGFVERIAASCPPLRHVHRQASDPSTLVQIPLTGCPRGHLAFGAGPHRCPGARLARLAARSVVSLSLPRLPDWHLVTAEVDGHGQLGGPTHLHVIAGASG